MNCETCRREVALVRKVRMRGAGPPLWGAGPPPGWDYHLAHLARTALRDAFICQACYRALNRPGGSTILGRPLEMSLKSRRDRAPIYNEEGYRSEQMKRASSS